MPVNVFLTDDSPETLEALTMVYNLHPGFEVVGDAKTSITTLTALQTLETDIDIISLDIQIGPDDGLQLCHQIHTEFPHLFIVMCSLEADPVIRTKAEQVGASYFLSKPFGMQELSRLLDAYRSYKHHATPQRDDEDDDLMTSLLDLPGNE